MKQDFSISVTGWFFLVGALMLWLGWVLMPWHIQTFFKPEDFSGVRDHFYLWIWMFRIHIFGFVILAMALVSLASLLTDSESRVLAWPGTAVAMIGLVVGALSAAFYYHHGAWGALQTQNASPETIKQLIDDLRLDTEYVTCLVRFSRVFLGLGLVVLAAAIFKWRLLPVWISLLAALLGVGAMAVTMVFPDNLEFYAPFFHLTLLWFAATGIVILVTGIKISRSELK